MDLADKNYSGIGYIKSFDGIRGLAVSLVLMLHGSYLDFKGGWIGVDLFFVLSGFLITSLLLKEYSKMHTISFYKFYARRCLRLIPPLIICIILCLLLSNSVNSPQQHKLLAVISSLFYLSDIVRPELLGNMSHLWSLSVEEHFYILWPAAMLLCVLKLKNKNRIILLAAIILLVTVFRIFIGNHPDFYNSSTFRISSYRFTFCRIDSILVGALLCFMGFRMKSNYGNKNDYGGILIILCFLIIGLTLKSDSVYVENGGFIITNILCAVTVAYASKNSENKFIGNSILTWLGKRSYGIYLYHYPIFFALEKFRVLHDLNNFIIILVIRFILAIAVAFLSYKFIEKPILNFKNRFQVIKHNSSIQKTIDVY